MKYALAVLALLILAGQAKADSVTTWDFSFQTIDAKTFQPNGIASGSATFQTLPTDESPYQNSLEIISTIGTMNGQPMTFVPSIQNAIDSNAATDPDTAFLNYSFYFDVNGVQYYIYDNDEPPVGGDYLVGSGFPPNPYDGYGELIEDTLTDPVSTPEPGMLALCSIGLLAVAAGFFVRRIN
jgi:hypothetical protein